jgi:phosphatidate cytidylyltransferase
MSQAEPLHPRPPTPAPEPRPAEKPKGGDLPRRLITAAVLVPLVLYIIALGGIPYLVTVIGFIVLGQREFYHLIAQKGAQPLVGTGLAAGAALPVVAYLGSEYHATLVMTAAMLGLMLAQLRKAQIAEAMASISGTFFGVFYVGWLFSHAIVLRRFYQVAITHYPEADVLFLGLHPDSGIFFMVFGAAVVVLCDTGAYFAGRAWGRHKLAPAISPGKTVEGALGGVVAGMLGGVVFKGLFDLAWPELSVAFPWSLVLPFACVLSVVGILGDLVESLLKRDAEVKDAGSILPGMGGILDRIDSPLLALPVLYYMLLGYLYVRLA